MVALEAQMESTSGNAAGLRKKLGDVCDERDDLVRQLKRAEHDAHLLARDNTVFGERNELLEEAKGRLEKENLDHIENIRRVSGTNAQLRQELEKRNVVMEQRASAHDRSNEELRSELVKARDDSQRYKEQRDAALRALDALQDEAKQSNLRANRLASNFDSVESELQDLRAQRNSAISQVNEARAGCERMRESLTRQQHEIAALQAFIDKHDMRQQESHQVDGFLEDMVQRAQHDAGMYTIWCIIGFLVLRVESSICLWLFQDVRVKLG